MSELVVAEDDVWLAAFGVAPSTEDVTRDEFVRQVRISGDGAGELHLTWDTTDRSVRLRLRRESVSLDLFREGASLLTVVDGDIVVEYGAPGFSGRTCIQVTPALRVVDRVLR
jgi:hypothetical protein